MRYFDLGEHVMNVPGHAESTLARIPKLGAQWKVIHEFNPTEYLQPGLQGPPRTAIWVRFAEECYSLAFSPNGVELWFEEEGDGFPGHIQDIAETQPDELPPIGEWTRIEMTLAVNEETGKYFISVSIAGIEVMKVMRQHDPETLVMDATIGCGDPHHAMSGGIRGLVVLEKS